MEKFKQLSIALPLACLFALSACGEQETAKEEEKFSIPVETALVETQNVSSFYTSTATLEAPDESYVMSRISGIIKTIQVEEGDMVEKGQVLAIIDAQRQEYDLSRSQAEVEIVEQELNRLKKINNKEFISQDAMAKLEFNLQAVKAQRDLAALHVKESTIVSPIKGVVAKRFVKSGNMAKEFDQLFYIVNQQELHGIVHLPEQQLSSIKLGQEANIIQQNQASLAKSFKASVLRISPIVDPSSGTFKVTLNIPNKQAQLKAGMFTRVELKYDTHQNVLTIPYNALINQDNINAVYVIDNNTAQRREVSIGYRENNIIEIIEGVNLGEKVVIRGQQNLKDQSLVEVISPLTAIASR